MTQPLPKLPIGVQDFKDLRENGYVYVDKTHHLYNIITGGKVYFLSRPRRFGKSLMISTLEAIFKGEKKLFGNTWIETSNYDWKIYPVIRVDMGEMPTKETPEIFKAALAQWLKNTAVHYDVILSEPVISLGSSLSELITLLQKKYGNVVVLVDEYDKPILDNITNTTLADTMRDILRQFYTILKSQDGNIRFVMLTGVTKFSKVSIFSGLNNLQDISLTEKYSALCGYTQNELETTFKPWIKNLADKQGTSTNEQLIKIKDWYNGYQFARNGERVYNPFSTLLLFEQQNYVPYWFATGTPTFLIDLIETAQFPPQEMESLSATDFALESQDITQLGLIALLYQTGYLTIQDYNTQSRLYRLSYPNFEVRESFSEALFDRLSKAPSVEQSRLLEHMINGINTENYGAVFNTLKTFLSAIPYQLHQPTEKYYHSLFYLIFHLVGYRVNAEVSTNEGRIDAIMEFKDRVLIFEFKLNQSANVALKQIHDKKYYLPYEHSGKKILLFGVNFDTEIRNIAEWVSETL